MTNATILVVFLLALSPCEGWHHHLKCTFLRISNHDSPTSLYVDNGRLSADKDIDRADGSKHSTLSSIAKVFDGSKNEFEDEDEDDLSSPLIIAQKLQGLASVASAKLGEEGNLSEGPAGYLSFLGMLQTVQKLEAQRAEARDFMYENSGIGGVSLDLAGIDEALEYSALAYEKETSDLRKRLGKANFKLLKHAANPKAGSVGHYIAICPERHLAVVGVKGTSTLGDVITDSCGQAVTHELEGPSCHTVLGDKRKSEVRCHEGILISAKSLAEEIEPFVEELLVPLGYKILIVGHSLGAGTGSLLGMLLCSRIPSLLVSSRWGPRGLVGGARRVFRRLLGKKSNTDISSIFDRGDKLHVVAFATPPVLDCESALACARFTTAIINDVDVIPRLSMSNVLILLKVLNGVNTRLEKKGIRPEENAKAEIGLGITPWISNSEEGETVFLGSDELVEEMDAALETVELNDPDHLYVPGRVLFMFKNHTEATRLASAAPADASPQGGMPAVTSLNTDFVVSDGTKKALRFVEMNDNMITDHYLRSYRNSVDALLSKYKMN